MIEIFELFLFGYDRFFKVRVIRGGCFGRESHLEAVRVIQHRFLDRESHLETVRVIQH